MTRWNWKRWAFAIVTGAALTTSLSTVASDELPKAGESITLKFPGQPDRVVTVVKATRKPDGSLETEVKDAKSGDTFTLVDPAPETKVPPAAPVPVSTKPAAPQALPPLPAPVSSNAAPTAFAEAKAPVAKPTPMPPMAESKDKRLLGGGKIFNREPEAIPNTPAAAAATPAAAADEKRPGIFGRVFGKKPTAAPTMPATSLATPAPVPTVRSNQEPPRAQSVKPVAPPAAPGGTQRVVPPTPIVPPVSAPTAPDSIPSPLPSKSIAPIPPIAAPIIPTPPPPPAKPTLPPIVVPTIPAVPMSAAPAPGTDVKPAAYTPVTTGLPDDVEPHAKTLKDAAAPSVRLKAVKELATGAHANTPAVQAVLFHTAKTDLCPAVKADCIEYLAKLGHRDPAFIEFVKAACSDESGEVRMAAKDAMLKLSSR